MYLFFSFYFQYICVLIFQVQYRTHILLPEFPSHVGVPGVFTGKRQEELLCAGEYFISSSCCLHRNFLVKIHLAALDEILKSLFKIHAMLQSLCP